MENEVCPNTGIAELLSGQEFTGLCCKICRQNLNQHECIKARIIKGTFPPDKLKRQKSKGKEPSIFKL